MQYLIYSLQWVCEMDTTLPLFYRWINWSFMRFFSQLPSVSNPDSIPYLTDAEVIFLTAMPN